MLEAAVAGLAGLLIGSFLNVCIYRLPRDLSVVRPRSYCPVCERTVAWYDNIPVLSFLLLGRRCRHCRTPIPWRYPMVELATGALFFLSVLWHGATWYGVKYCLFSAILVDLIVTDLEERILPDEFTLGGTALGLVLAWFAPIEPGIVRLFVPYEWTLPAKSLAEAVCGALFSGGAIWAIGAVYEKVRGREGLGLGDVKMLLMIGAFLGMAGSLLSMFAGSVVGAVAGLVYIAVARKDMTYELPFGTFLGLAALLVGLGGGRLTEWYLSLG